MDRKTRIFFLLVGIPLLGIGIALFRLSQWGNDPSTAMVMALSDRIGVDYALLILFTNAMFFIIELIYDRGMIGIGTFYNWTCVGLFGSFFERIIRTFGLNLNALPTRIMFLTTGILILSFSCALYQCANLGIAPYDSVSLIMSKRFHVPYFWCRVATDAICGLIAFFFGGILGLGTLVCAFGLGPFITFFTHLLTNGMRKKTPLVKKS